ncbi:MAG: phage protein [Burkholderiales bacterium]
MAVYSFQNVVATVTGPGGFASLGEGSASAKEGITIEQVEDSNIMTIGADGAGMHSLIVTTASTVTARLLKTSPINAILQAMFNLQTASSLLHGQNVITITDIARGDTITAIGGAFKKPPSLTWASEGGINEWIWDCIQTVRVLGIGQPSIV